MKKDNKTLKAINKTLKYFELLMVLNNLENVKEYILKDEYKFVFFNGDKDIQSWIQIHIESGEFSSSENALQYFHQFYDPFINELNERCLFIEDKDRNKVATATISPSKDFGYDCVIDWFAVSRKEQGKGLAKPLLSKLVIQAKKLGHKNILLHTQTHTYLAAKIYLDYGFEPFYQKELKGWRILKTIIDHEKLKSITPIKEKNMYDKRVLRIKKQLDTHFENYNFSVWYVNGRNDVYVYDNNSQSEYHFKFYQGGNKLK